MAELLDLLRPRRARADSEFTFPPPVRGLNSRHSLSDMEIDFALELINFEPAGDRLRCRRGYTRWAELSLTQGVLTDAMAPLQVLPIPPLQLSAGDRIEFDRLPSAYADASQIAFRSINWPPWIQLLTSGLVVGVAPNVRDITTFSLTFEVSDVFGQQTSGVLQVILVGAHEPLAAPSQAVATRDPPAAGLVRLRWVDADPAARQTAVEARQAGPWREVARAFAPADAATAALPGSGWSVRLRAASSGRQPSAWTAVPVVDQAREVPPPSVGPMLDTPDNVVAQRRDGAGTADATSPMVSLSWDAVPGASTYAIWQTTADGSQTLLLLSARTTVDLTLDRGGLRVSVSARDPGRRESARSAVVVVPQRQLSPVQNVSTTRIPGPEAALVGVSWSAGRLQPPSAKFQVETQHEVGSLRFPGVAGDGLIAFPGVSDDGILEFPGVASEWISAGNDTPFFLTGIPLNGDAWLVRVRAVADGYLASEWKTHSAPDQDLRPISLPPLRCSRKADGFHRDVDVSWDDVPGIVEYRLQTRHDRGAWSDVVSVRGRRPFSISLPMPGATWQVRWAPPRVETGYARPGAGEGPQSVPDQRQLFLSGPRSADRSSSIDDTVVLSWPRNPYAAGYTVRFLLSGGEWQERALAASEVSTRLLLPGDDNRAEIKVEPLTGFIGSDWTPFNVPDQSIPDAHAPAGLSASRPSAHRPEVDLSWTPPQDATAQRLWLKRVPGGWVRQAAAVLDGTSTSYRARLAGTGWQFRVTAVVAGADHSAAAAVPDQSALGAWSLFVAAQGTADENRAGLARAMSDLGIIKGVARGTSPPHSEGGFLRLRYRAQTKDIAYVGDVRADREVPVSVRAAPGIEIDAEDHPGSDWRAPVLSPISSPPRAATQLGGLEISRLSVPMAPSGTAVTAALWRTTKNVTISVRHLSDADNQIRYSPAVERRESDADDNWHTQAPVAPWVFDRSTSRWKAVFDADQRSSDESVSADLNRWEFRVRLDGYRETPALGAPYAVPGSNSISRVSPRHVAPVVAATPVTNRPTIRLSLSPTHNEVFAGNLKMPFDKWLPHGALRLEWRATWSSRAIGETGFTELTGQAVEATSLAGSVRPMPMQVVPRGRDRNRENLAAGAATRFYAFTGGGHVRVRQLGWVNGSPTVVEPQPPIATLRRHLLVIDRWQTVAVSFSVRWVVEDGDDESAWQWSAPARVQVNP